MKNCDKNGEYEYEYDGGQEHDDDGGEDILEGILLSFWGRYSGSLVEILTFIGTFNPDRPRRESIGMSRC